MQQAVKDWNLVKKKKKKAKTEMKKEFKSRVFVLFISVFQLWGFACSRLCLEVMTHAEVPLIQTV